MEGKRGDIHCKKETWLRHQSPSARGATPDPSSRCLLPGHPLHRPCTDSAPPRSGRPPSCL